MKPIIHMILITLAAGCTTPTDSRTSDNPFFAEFNIPIDYAAVSPTHIEEYANVIFSEAIKDIESIKQNKSATFDNVFVAIDNIINKTSIAANNCFMLYWVSPDSLSRIKGFSGYQLLDSLSTGMRSDKALYDIMLLFNSSDAYTELTGHRKNLVDDMMQDFKQSGVNLDEKQLLKFKTLTKEITQLTSDYSTNMNASRDVLRLDEKSTAGLPENFRDTYKTKDSKYEIPIINATLGPVIGNAESEEVRKAYYYKFYNRASDKNLKILDDLVQKRYELANIMGYDSYAAYSLKTNMAKNPETVWAFINDLIDRSKEKAKSDVEVLNVMKRNDLNLKPNQSGALQPWDISFYNNQILKTKYQVDNEKIREYLPMEKCLSGVFNIYQELLELEFRKVNNPSVWHPEVEMYEVFEGDNLKGRFYLDLFPRPNKESWFYGVNLIPGKATESGYEVPAGMLLGNFTRPTATLPSLLSHNELRILFHEFGHIINSMSYDGEFASQSQSKSDFGEAMSQIFENWIWDYDMLSSFAMHYKTGDVLPKETFDNMTRAKNVGAGLSTLSTLRSCVYDLNLYDKYDPEAPVNTDDIWKNIDEEFGVMPLHVEGTHVQASWIHINTHPVYMYGYLWSRVYAQDMFTEFETKGLTDKETGLRYRKLILANGTQRDIVKAVEEFLGRPSNNKAYIRSLGLD